MLFDGQFSNDVYLKFTFNDIAKHLIHFYIWKLFVN